MDNFYKFDDISYNPHTRELIKQRESIYLRRKVSEVLDILLKNRHRIVGREELLTSIWREGAIRENSLLQCVRELRQILGDNVQQPKYIKTYHTNGYQWIDTHIAIIETDNNTALEQVTTNI
ncbi:MAG: transcriptional regulator, partial [Thiohalomonadales bacterium]